MSRTKKNKPGSKAQEAKAAAAAAPAVDPAADAPVAAAPAESSTTTTESNADKPGKKGKLIRPRGKRGGIKHQKGGAARQAAVKKAASKEARKLKGKSTSTSDDHADGSAAPVPPAEHAEKIAKFHTLLKQLEQAKTAEEKDEIQAGLDSLGGLAQYQAWSLTGSAKGGQTPTSKWCIEALNSVYKHGREQPKFRVLDVGAITGTAYTKYRWIDATSIDLHPQGDNVQKYSFFDFPVPTAEEDKFSMVALSLVINFVGDVRKRGDMLRHVHKYLPTDDRPGFLFLVLPLNCLTNSRYMNQSHLRSILDSLGFTVLKQSDSAKLSRWLLQRKPLAERREAAAKTSAPGADDEWDGTVFKKRDVNPGNERNNFAIVVDPKPE